MKRMVYNITIAGVNRDLQLCRLNDDLYIAGLVIYGDVELTCRSAAALLKLAPDFDYLIAPEAKAIPLIHEMARQSGRNDYILARKAPKLYMKDIFEVEVRSITTAGTQKLYLDGADAARMKGKRILIVDDVVSTGESLRAMEALVNKAGGNIIGRMSILAEGDAKNRTDLIYLEPLPLFNNDGKPL
jgi:adenine phosphoribosyltransferase